METAQYRVLEHAELRTGSKDRTIVGYAAVFGELSEILRAGYREIIKPGAFAKTITTDDIRALRDHDPRALLARNKSGTLKLREDAHGLHTEISVPRTQLGDEVYESVRRGDLSQMSFGMHAIDRTWITRNGEHVQELREAQLFDVSLVTYPAYVGTSAEARSRPIGLPANAEIGTYSGIATMPVTDEEISRLRLRLELLQRL
jgi:HK97 family phage prohead protease